MVDKIYPSNWRANKKNWKKFLKPLQYFRSKNRRGKGSKSLKNLLVQITLQKVIVLFVEKGINTIIKKRLEVVSWVTDLLQMKENLYVLIRDHIDLLQELFNLFFN